MGFTAQQFMAIRYSERIMSALSLLGSLFIIVTFLKWHYFRKPINRLVFYASFGNIMANIATLISTSVIPKQGEEPSAACQLQGVLIQWFMMADSIWVFCMALNVMLVFFHQYNSRQLRHLEKWYLLFAYGIPFIPAFVYVVVEKVTHKRIYGPATIWCWVDKRVEWLRIVFFYAPVWIVLTLTVAIYIYTGHHIFQRRKDGVHSLGGSQSRGPISPPPVVANPFTATNMNRIERTTEISVRYTNDSMDSGCTIAEPKEAGDSRSSFSSTRKLSVKVQALPIPSPMTCPSRSNSAHATPEISSQHDEPLNRTYRAAVIADTGTRKQPHSSSRPYNPNQRRNTTMDGNSAAWSYFKVAFLMFAALFVVWVPSTVNRLQQFIHKDNPVFGLNLASAMVLPLQGFWNSMVYMSTTWPECKRAVREMCDWFAGMRQRGSRPAAPGRMDSEHTLNATEPDDFEIAEIPTRNARERRPSYSPGVDFITKPAQLQLNA